MRIFGNDSRYQSGELDPHPDDSLLGALRKVLLLVLRAKGYDVTPTNFPR